MAQFARPNSDVTLNTWTINGGSTTDLWSAIDESTFSDTDYVLNATNGNDVYEAALTDITDPQTNTGHVVRYRYSKSAAAGNSRNITVGLYQGGTLIAEQTHTGISETWTAGSFTLTGTQADSITDYTDLRIRFTAGGTTGGPGGNRRSVQGSWAELETPDAPASFSRAVAATAAITIPRGVVARAAISTGIEPAPDGATVTSSGQNVTSRTFSYTTPANPSLLLVTISNRAPFSHTEATSVTWNGQSLTFIGRRVGAGSDHSVEFWGLARPTANTTGDIIATFPDTRSVVIGAQSWKRVDATAALSATVTGNASSTGTTASTTVSTSTGQVVVGVLQRINSETVTCGVDQDQTYQLWSGSEVLGASSYQTASGSSTTNSWTFATSTYWTHAVIVLSAGPLISTRSVAATASISVTEGGTRSLAATAAISATNSRAVAATVAISAIESRAVAATASISEPGGGGGSPPTAVGTTTFGNDVSGTNGFTVTLPTSRVVDEYVVIGVGSSGGSINTPSGWTAITPNADISNPTVYPFYRKIDGTENDTVAFTRGASGVQNVGWVAQRISGADDTTFLDVAAVKFSDSLATATSLGMSITTESDQTLLLGLVAVNSSSTVVDPPSGWTELGESNGGRKIEMAVEEQAAAGASGTHTWTWASGRATAGVLIAIRPVPSDSPSRTLAATAAIQVTSARSVAATASIEALGGTRSVAADASISAGVTITGSGQGHWRWYTDATPDGSMTALASEDTTPTLTGAQVMGGILRLRTQLFDTGNITALNAEYSVDGTNWNDVADLTPTSTTVNRWIRFVNGAATASGTLGSLLLPQSTAAGKYHEDLGIAETVGGGAVVEIDLALKMIWPPPDTTILIRLLDGATPIALATGATQISFTTCAPSERDFTVDKANANTSGGQNRELNHGQWSRLHYDGTDWWFFAIQPDDGTNLSYWRWPNGSGAWGSRQTVSMTVNAATTSENDVKHNTAFAVIGGTHVVSALFAPSSGNMHLRRGRFTGGAITWNTDTDLGQARYNAHSHVAIDDGGYHWIGGINGTSGVWACRSTAADDGSSGYEPAFGTISTRRKTVADATVAAGNRFALVNIGSDKVLALWNTGSTLKAAICSDASGFGSVVTVNTTASAHPDDWGVTRIGNTVYVVHSDSTATGGTWRTRLYSISGDSWSAGTDPGAAQPTQNSNADGLVLSNDGTNVYAFGTTIGFEGGQDRTVSAIKWDSAAWSDLGYVTPSGGRGNGDDIAGADVAGGGKLPIAYLMNDNDVNGFPFTYEVHHLTLATTSSRAVAATAAISTTNTRSVGATAAINTTANQRTLGASAAIQVTSTRTLGATAAISETLSRSVAATAAISTSDTARTLAATAAIQETLSRALAATAAVSETLSRPLTATAAIQETLSRPLAATAALQTSESRVLAATASISGGTVRSVAATAAISTIESRALTAAAAISTIANGRAVAATAAISETLSRALATTAAVQVTSTNSVATTASISLPGGTQSRAVAATAAISTTNSRAVDATASIGFMNRVVDSAANTVITTASDPVFVTSFELISTRTLTATAAIQTTSTRILGATAAVSESAVRVLGASASISESSTRSLSATAAISAVSARSVAATVAISMGDAPRFGGLTRTQPVEPIAVSRVASVDPLSATRDAGVVDVLAATRDAGVVDVLAATRQATALDVAISRQASDEPLAVARTNGPDPLSATRTAGEL